MSAHSIPFGVSSRGELLRAKQAVKSEQYRCPSCMANLILKKGSLKRPYFSHPPETGCNVRDIWKQTAKLLIVGTIHKWKREAGPSPIIKRLCHSCFSRRDFKLLETVEGAVEDVAIDDTHRADVVLLANNSPVLAIQIAIDVSDEKNDLGRALPWLELNAKEVISNPLVWDTLCESLGHFVCQTCEKLEKEQERAQQRMKKGKHQNNRVKRNRRRRSSVSAVEQEEERAMRKKKEREHRSIKKLAHSHKIALPLTSSYQYRLFTCKGCGKGSIVFTWSGHKIASVAVAPPEPRPSLLQLREVPFDNDDLAWMNQPRFANGRKADEYWVNCCLHCGVTIKDEWLYSYDGVFGREFFNSRNRGSSNGQTQ